MDTAIRTSKRYRIKESYRNQAYVGVVNLDPRTTSWSWKGHVDSNKGLHSICNSCTFTTALDADRHLRQFAHHCIDNPRNATHPYRLYSRLSVAFFVLSP